MHKPTISIVIGTLGRPIVVTKLLDDLVKYSKKISFEVLVFDQSKENDYKYLVRRFPKSDNFTLLHNNEPNTCRYLNLGWKKARADIVLYLDDDVRITNDTLSAHIKSYLDKKVKGVAGRVINSGEFITDIKSVGNIKWKGALFNKNFSSSMRCLVDFPYGCNMSFRRSALLKLGGFDEKLKPPIYSFNEIDIGLRLNKSWPNSLIFEPEALVYHDRYPYGGTRTYSKDQVDYWNNFNYGYFLSKNYSWLENLFFCVRRLPYQLLLEPKGILPIINGFVYGKRVKRQS